MGIQTTVALARKPRVTSTSSSPQHRVVIVGGGAGGLELATLLGRRLGRPGSAEITLVDAAETHLWKPLLHEVAAGTLDSNGDELSYLALGKQNHFRYRFGRVTGLDRVSRTLTLAAEHDQAGSVYLPAREVRYDTLVLAVGSVTNDFGTDGVSEHCFFLDAREQADAFHQHLLRACFAASADKTSRMPGALHIAIAGAGATGVELAAELCDMREALAEHHLDNLDPIQDIELTLVEGADRVLPALPERLSVDTHRVLERLRVNVLTGRRIARATASGFETTTGEVIAARIMVWAAGVRGASEMVGLGGLETNERNQFVVRKTLATTLDARIYALGDCAACAYPSAGATALLPPRAQVAHQQAALLARSLAGVVTATREPLVFHYNDLGSLVNLSRYETVGKLMGAVMGKATGALFIEGLLARWAYRSLYKSHRAVVLGWPRVLVESVAAWLGSSTHARVKLH